MISINVLSWNRPFLLNMTLGSLLQSLRGYTNVEVLLLDQGSNNETRKVIEKYRPKLVKVIQKEENIGMARAWRELFQASRGDCIISLEDDWWCNARSPQWLVDAEEILKKHREMAFIKLRRIRDRQYGTGLINKEAWTVRPFPRQIVQVGTLPNGCRYYYCPARNNTFTFNPILMKRKFREEFDQYFVDNPNSKTSLRSGEDIPTMMWEQQDKWFAGTLVNGPFRHIGFRRKKEFIRWLLPFYFKHLFNMVFP